MPLHCEKGLLILASHQKIPLPRIDNPAVDYGTFFPPPRDLFRIPPCQKTLRVPGRRPFTSEMPEKSSDPWNATFYIPPSHKSLAPGRRPGLTPGTRIFLLGSVRKTFPAWAREKKQKQGYLAATFIMQWRPAAKVEPTTAETLARAWVPARAWTRARSFTPVTLRPTTNKKPLTCGFYTLVSQPQVCRLFSWGSHLM